RARLHRGAFTQHKGSRDVQADIEGSWTVEGVARNSLRTLVHLTVNTWNVQRFVIRTSGIGQDVAVGQEAKWESVVDSCLEAIANVVVRNSPIRSQIVIV